ncbi:porin [Rhodoblastus sp.]|uniref:porin n=1 Tax=Rhodoblastus sp. TaxID=1962975 RepID=UPI003F9BEFE2
MKRFLLILLTATGLAGVANAQSLPSAKAPEPAAEKPSCFADFSTYMNSSVKDCPLSYAGVTLFGNIDGGYGYEEHGVPMGYSADKVNYAIQRNSNRSTWLWSPNGASTSTVGVKIEEKLFDKWLFIAAADTGFNPYSMNLIDGPQSLADNNLNKALTQRSHFDSSRAGQWDNGQGFFGFSNPDYGTLTFGRTNSLASGVLGSYDPVASVAFSQIGFSSAYAGFGISPSVRVNTALTYRLTYQGFRIAGQAQIGGYELGNASTSSYQLQLGADFGNFSFDVVGGTAQNSVALSTYGGSGLPAGYDPNSILKATVGNNAGVEVLASYKWDKFKFYAGYIYGQTNNPTNTYYPGGLPTIISAGLFVPPGAVTTNAYNVPRDQNTVWTGVRYSAMKNLDLSAGVYWESQNDYLQGPALCTGSGIYTSSSKCSGGRYSYSFMADWKPIPRVDVYAGLMVSTVYGGVASGFLYTQNIDPMVGVRFRF